MKILVMGSGGVGGYFGGRLAQAGCDVHFVARGAHGQALREHGLRISSPLGGLHLQQASVTDDPARVGRVDLVLFGVKLWDTQAAARQLAPVLGPDTAVISFQNGVVKDDLLRDVLGTEHVAGGVAYIAASIGEPGVIVHNGNMAKLVFGEHDGRASARLTGFAEACAAAGITHELTPRIHLALWEKFVFLAALSAATTLARLPVGPIRDHPRARTFLHDLMDEAVQVGRAEGVPLPPEYAESRLAFADGLPATMTSSMHHDLERGHRLELPWLSGDVVARGRRLGVPTPCHRAVVDMLSPHADGRAAVT
ncbi:MAG: 2-dehydropantoate 2-reductase [Rubrivivax sp.]|nr:2-dehydropantoate 2-reductase [Rubrivivax sp.]